MKNKFIYADLNELKGSRIVITNPLSFKEILDRYGEAYNGMELNLWTDDLDQNNKYDPMVYSGKLVFNLAESNWFMEINPNEIEHLSKSKKYQHYSLSAVLGDTYDITKKNHPEWF
jgi:hypothetical protein